jgi:hypothetical protein
MCFSASASFTAASILGFLGFVAQRMVNVPRQRFLASIPAFFAVQQLCEGIIWLSWNPNQQSWIAHAAATLFLVIAFGIWPTLIPLSLNLFYRRGWHPGSLLLIITGLITSIGLGIFLARTPFGIQVDCHHIMYQLDYSSWHGLVFSVTYVVATIVPFFEVRNRLARVIGIALALSYIIAHPFYQHATVSVWCFFAALLSGAVILMIWRQRSLPTGC